MNKELEITDKDVTITTDGKAFISQVKLAQLLGVPRTTLREYIYKNSATLKLNENNQLSAESVHFPSGYFAAKGNPKAIKVMSEIAASGSIAWVYHIAGYTMKAEKPAPKTALELAREQVVLLERIEELEIKHARELIAKDNQIIDLRFENLDLKERDLNQRIEIASKGLLNLPKT